MDISILHLSDLHIVEKNGTYSEILGYLIDDIKEQCLYLKHIVLVITGDIINKAFYTDKNKKITLNFFHVLHKEIGDKIVGVEIVPGNHDKEQHEINKKLVEEQRISDKISNISEKEWEYYLVSFKQYLALMNEIRSIFNKNSVKINNTYYVESIDEKDFKVIFINLDTSWSSYGGNIDKRNLCIDEQQLNILKDAYQKEKRDTSKKYLTIMTAHHPLNWLKEKDETFISPWLLNSEYFNIDLYLCGHTHDRQIKSFLDTHKSYITLVTGIGWDEATPDEQKDKHRYSIYNLNLSNGSCEIIIRKTCADGKFDYDNDVLLTPEEKEDKRIYLSLEPFDIKPKIKIPVYINNTVKNEYLFVNKKMLEETKQISDAFYEVANHMALFQAMHVRDFFVKYELNKTSKGTVIKQEVYDDYFYKSIESNKVNELFSNIKNYSIIYENFVSYLRELCGTIVNELNDRFSDVKHIRVHFRKYYKNTTGKDLYIAFCQATSLNHNPPPAIRDLEYDNSMLKIAFENQSSFVFKHNKMHNPLSMINNMYDDFITMTSQNSKNIYTFKENRKDTSRPFLTASLSVSYTNRSDLLDILNYLDIGEFIFKLVYDYVSLFKINMEEFIKIEEDDEN